MITLKDVKDWLKTQVSMDVWEIGTYDIPKDRTVCAHNLTSNRSMLVVGGLQNTTIAVKDMSIVMHWNKNLGETERVTRSIYAPFYGQQPKVGDYRVIKYDMRSDEPISVGTNTNGMHEYVIETWLTCERKE